MTDADAAHLITRLEGYLRERDERIAALEAELAQRTLEVAMADASRKHSYDERDKLKAERDEARRERDDVVRELKNLLAIIHRDGGQHTFDRGLSAAIADAHKTWATVIAERDALALALRAYCDDHNRASFDLSCGCALCIATETALTAPGAARVLREVEALRALAQLVEAYIYDADDHPGPSLATLDKALQVVEESRKT
jgi:hypothetical protein